MTNYRAILLYYSKGNTTTQIATICDCSRTTVLKTIKRVNQIKLKVPVSDEITDKELYFMLYPKRGPKKGYLKPDIWAIDKDRKKRCFNKYRAWQKYCRVARRDGYKAYGKSWFYKLYKDKYTFGVMPLRAKQSENLQSIFKFTLRELSIVAARVFSEYKYRLLEQEIEEWCKKRRLDKDKIWGATAVEPIYSCKVN